MKEKNTTNQKNKVTKLEDRNGYKNKRNIFRSLWNIKYAW